MSNDKKPAPVEKLKIGLLTAAIWENVTEQGKFYNVTFDRRFNSKDGWKSTRSYGLDDLLAQAKLTDRAHTRILELLAQDRQDAQADEDAGEASY